MRHLGALRNTVSRFGSDAGGNFAILFGGVATMLAIAVGFGVDTAQMMNAKSALRAAVDSAVTSTARDLTTGKATEDEAKDIVKAFLSANNPNGVLPDEQIVLDDLIINHADKTIQAKAHVDVRMFFPVFGLDNVRRVSDIGAAIYSDKQIEVAMMLDMTGSMKGQKIEDLKTAATNAVNSMLANQDPDDPRVRVAIVPYASGVNVGSLSSSTYAETSSSSDLPPVAGSALLVNKTKQQTLPAFAQYQSVVSTAFPYADACATERKDRNGNADFSADGPSTIRTDKSGKQYYALVNRDDRLSGSGMNKCPDAKVIPLTADSSSLLKSIKSFKANGYTGGAIGVQWTYYMLSSQWRSAIQAAGLGDGPTNANVKKISKVAILMTDGEFNTAYAGTSDFNRSREAIRNSADKAIALCTAMKNQDIEIFTIGFGLKQANAIETLKACATPDHGGMKYFYSVSTGNELVDVYKEIAAAIKKLRLIS